jgi:hypothetical protein
VVLRPVLLREDVLRVEVPRRAAVARPPARPAARFCAVVPARPPLRPAAARRADVVLRDAVLRVVLRARVPVVRRVPVERALVVRRPIGLRGLRAAARPPARAAVVRLARVDEVRPVVLRVPVERALVVRRPIGLRGLRAAARPPARAAAVRLARVVEVRPVVLRRVVVRPVVERAAVVRRVPVARRVPVERRVPVLRAVVLRPLVDPLRAVDERRVVPLERRVPPVRSLVPSSSTPSMSSNICLLLLRDFLDDLACLCVLALSGDIGLGQDSNEAPVFLRDGQPADLVLRHQAQRFIQVLFRIDGHEIARGDLTRSCRLRILRLRNDADHDVAIRHHPDELIAVDDRNRSDVFGFHQARCFGDRRGRLDAAGVTRHYVTDVLCHRSSSLPPYAVRVALLPTHAHTQTTTVTNVMQTARDASQMCILCKRTRAVRGAGRAHEQSRVTCTARAVLTHPVFTRTSKCRICRRVSCPLPM